MPYRSLAAIRFTHSARAARRRPVFFAVESLEPYDGFRHLSIGLQSVLHPERWPDTLRGSRKLREQLRRARAKGVSVRVVQAREVEMGTPLRREVERLRWEWLTGKRMEPMGFVVAVEPFHAPEEHLYLVAELGGRAVQFLSAVPIYESRGWLLEDMLRGTDAPNGTTELLIDLAMRTVRGQALWITPGLTPLVGAMPRWLRIARFVATPLYDFEGLRRFRSRLSPTEWNPIWLVWDRGPALLVLGDVLRAFAFGRPVSFAWRSLTRHSNGPPWAVAVPLVVWTHALAILAVTGNAGVLGFSHRALMLWIAFDLLLSLLLFRASQRPSVRRLAPLTLAAAWDALVSVQHLTTVGLGDNALSAVFRLAATAGPIIGTTALAWATYLASGFASRRQR